MAKRVRNGLPGGRGQRRTKDAYVGQAFEYEQRIDQTPGYVCAVLQTDLTTATGTITTVVWAKTTLSMFIPSVVLFGWTYDGNGFFTCRRPGLYRTSFSLRINNALAADVLGAQLRLVRGSNTLLVFDNDSAGGVNVSPKFSFPINFKTGDIISLEFSNQSANNRTVAAMGGFGTVNETLRGSFLTLEQID